MSVAILANIAHLASWSWQPLWSAAPRVQESGQPHLQSLSVFLEDGVVPRAERADNYNRLGEDLTKYLVVRPGDVVFNKLRTWQGGLGVSRYSGLVSPAYFVCRPSERTDPQFLHYLLRSTPYLAELKRRSKWMPPSQFDIPWEQLRGLPLLLPPIEEQRRIANFLDRSTATIQQQLVMQARLRELLHHRELSVLETLLTPPAGDETADWSWKPLALFTEPSRPIMYGIVLPGPNVDDGVPIVKGGDVAAKRLRPELLNKTTRDIESRYARSRLKGGDLVIAIRGSVGEVAAVPDELAGANLTQDAARISVGRDVDRRWLELVLQAPAVVRDIQSKVTGATVKGINICDLKRVLLPVPGDRNVQARLARTAALEVERHEAIISASQAQTSLLGERKRALITAAVTGQIDVTTAQGAHA